MYDTTHHTVSKMPREGKFRDVHTSGTHIVALEDTSLGDLVQVFSSTDPPTHSHSFSLNHADAFSVMAHSQHIYVSAWYNNTSVSVYNLQGQMISKYGSLGKTDAGQMDFPYLCGVDSADSLLIADFDNKRLQLMDKRGEFRVVEGMGDKHVSDAVIVDGDMFVLSRFFVYLVQPNHIK